MTDEQEQHILDSISCSHLKHALYTIGLAQKLADYHFNTTGRTLNPFCPKQEALEFEAYCAMAEYLHSKLQLLTIH